MQAPHCTSSESRCVVWPAVSGQTGSSAVDVLTSVKAEKTRKPNGDVQNGRQLNKGERRKQAARLMTVEKIKVNISPKERTERRTSFAEQMDGDRWKCFTEVFTFSVKYCVSAKLSRLWESGELGGMPCFSAAETGEQLKLSIAHESG